MPQIFHRSANTLAKVGIAGVLLLAGGLIGLIMILGRSNARGARLPRPLVSAEQWGARVLGRRASRWLLGPALQGIYAADTARLSASLVFGTRERPARRARKGLVAPARGMQQLIDALEWRLRTREVSIRLNTPARLDGSTPAVICTSACDAAEILRDVAPAASQGFPRLTIRGRSHTLPRHVASEAEHERVQAPCSRDFQLLTAKQI